jgi:hypothetical protein
MNIEPETKMRLMKIKGGLFICLWVQVYLKRHLLGKKVLFTIATQMSIFEQITYFYFGNR